MNFNEVLDRALEQAREMQRQAADAATQAAEQMKPYIERSLANAHELQDKLSRHATESGEAAAAQTASARGHVNEFIRMGGVAMRESAEQARVTAAKMTEQSRKIIDAMTGAPEEPK